MKNYQQLLCLDLLNYKFMFSNGFKFLGAVRDDKYEKIIWDFKNYYYFDFFSVKLKHRHFDINVG